MTARRQQAFVAALAALAGVAILTVIPTPLYLLAPGNAVDLTTRVSVEGHAPPHRRYFLTDVTLTRASVALLAARAFPGVRIVRRDAVIPAGETTRSYDRLLYDAMSDSQNVAALVAERAAGYAVALPAEEVVVAGVLPGSHAAGIVKPGDRLLRIEGRPIVDLRDVSRAVGSVRTGARIAVDVDRSGSRVTVSFAPLASAAGPKLGVLVRSHVPRAQLAIPVRFEIGDITGSSGGLMFALAIYAQLRPSRGPAGGAVAGTGTLDRMGRVGPIEGALQKYIAARRTGAALFLVPRQNYPEIAAERGPRIVPVATFEAALAALGS